jgi:hypothetical protein
MNNFLHARCLSAGLGPGSYNDVPDSEVPDVPEESLADTGERLNLTQKTCKKHQR